MTRAEQLGITDADLEVLRPQYEAVRKMLGDHRLSWPLDNLAARITLKIVAMTFMQVSEAVPGLTEVPR